MTILATLSHFECSERDAYAIGVFESSRSAFDGHYPGNPIVPGNFILATFLWMAQKMNPTNEVHTIRNLWPLAVPRANLDEWLGLLSATRSSRAVGGIHPVQTNRWRMTIKLPTGCHAMCRASIVSS